MQEIIIIYKESSWKKSRDELGESDIATMALVDDEDLPFLERVRWYLSVSGYAVRLEPRSDSYGLIRYSMHREILKYHGYNLKGKVVDHMDRNRLNNQKNNLRICDVLQNNQNKPHKATERSPYKGVKIRKDGKFNSQIKVRIDLGVYLTAEEARDAYLDMARDIYGEFVNCENL